MKEDLENKICMWFSISRTQRQNELARGDGLAGTKGYEDLGCYSCDGFNKECELYKPITEVKINYDDDSKHVRGYN